MIRNTMWTAVLAVALVSALPARADYEAGRRAWDTGRHGEALARWRAAAESGDRRAMLALGRLFVQGLGAPQDYVEAHKWLNLAASRGEAAAANERDALATKMTPQQVSAAQERAAAWRPGETRDVEAPPAPVPKARTQPTQEPGPPPARAIREAQALLAALGYQPGPADGVWGRRSARAMGSFLLDAGLPAGEVLTPEALRAMRAIVKRRGGSADVALPRGEPPKEAKRPEPERPPGTVFRDCAECPELVILPAGSYMMGSPPGEKERHDDEGPRHRVRISRPFAVGRYEVTFSEWEACRRAGGCSRGPGDAGWGRGNRPVINVGWTDARKYVRWLSRKTGKRYRLSSESEWEYAARAGTTGPFHHGSTISTEQANYDGDYAYGSGRKGRHRGRTTPVGSFPPNGFGLYDVHGNVSEWVEDCRHDDYSGAPSDGSAWIRSGNCRHRVLRGGSWCDRPGFVRSAYRYRHTTCFGLDYTPASG